MGSKSIALFFALLVAVAQAAPIKFRVPSRDPKLGAPPPVVTSPEAVARTPTNKACPPGYEPRGAHCEKTVSVPAQPGCPPSFSLVDEQCLKWVGKLPRCPMDFKEVKIQGVGQCIQIEEAEPDYSCPPEFVLAADADKCVKQTPLPPTYQCPTGTIQKGDFCAAEETLPPHYVCPPGYKIQGRLCVLEETYDCTPPYKAPKLPDLTEHHQSAQHGGHHGSGNKHLKTGTYNIRDKSKTETTVVINKTCKRIKTEAARKICKEGVLLGHSCVVESHVPVIVKPGGFAEEYAPLSQACPKGFNTIREEDGTKCYLEHEAPQQYHCPKDTIDKGEKCAVIRELDWACPKGFKMENDVCIQRRYAPPKIEFTVTYQCQGKDCAENSEFVASNKKGKFEDSRE